MTRIFAYDDEDNLYEHSEVSDETITQLRSIDYSECKTDMASFIEQMDKNRIGKCRVCGAVVKVGWQMLDSDGKATGVAICQEHDFTGTKNGDWEKFKLYDHKKEVREKRNAKARAKAEAHQKRCEEIEARGDKVCGRCGGYGIISAFIHVNGGECFECQGLGFTNG